MVNFFIKRFGDILLSSILLCLLSPIIIIVCLMIKVFMPGPILFKQIRVGKNKKKFEILKFRSMSVDVEAEKNLDFSKDKQRITWLGKILRRTKIDELPQLLNVLKGDMSLVGPRPTIMSQVENYSEYQLQRLNVRPGMTGLAQVNGNIYLDWEERINYDIQYVNRFTILLDLKILLKTVGIIILGESKFKKN